MQMKYAEARTTSSEKWSIVMANRTAKMAPPTAMYVNMTLKITKLSLTASGTSRMS